MTRVALDRSKLASVLGLLSSDALGERAAAGLLATRMLKAAGLTWHDVLQPTAAPPTSRPYTRPTPQTPAFDQQRAASLEMCRIHASRLTPWELDFLTGISRRRALSPKQLATLTGIASDLAQRAAR